MLISVVIGSISILLVPDILNQNTVSNVLQLQEAYWLGENVLFYFEINNPTDRYFDDVTLHLDFIGFENVYGDVFSSNPQYFIGTCDYRNEANISPNGNVTFTSRRNFCYFEKVKLTATVGTDYILEKTVNVEQRGKSYGGIIFSRVAYSDVAYTVTDNNTTLKSTFPVYNNGTANVEITEVYKDGILCENVTITPFSNNLVPVGLYARITIFQPTLGRHYDEDSIIRGRYEIVSSEGETFSFSSTESMFILNKKAVRNRFIMC